jgi:CubicO group peptidase (beta-lactamase class C family)
MPVRSRSALFALIAIILPGLIPGRPAAQAPNYQARLDSLFTIFDTNQRMMGSVTVRKGDRVLYQRTLGSRDSTAAGWVPSDSLTAFRIGSVTKPFTAVLIYQLVDEHKLSLDTKLSKFFPQIKGADAITIRDLLGHTSGLPDYTQGMNPMVRLDRDALLRRISAEPPQFKAGTKRRYSNSNYLLLGYVIEAVTKSTCEAQLKKRIVDRVGLTRTHFGGPVTPGANESRAYFFSAGHWELQPDHVIENAGAAGGIVSTSNDLTRFLSTLFQGRLISSASLKEMTNGYTEGADRYGKGLGPFAIPRTSKSGFSHDGSIGAHAALIGYVPEDSLSLALTINGYNYPQNRIFFLVWNILYGTDMALPSFTPVTLTDAAAAPLAGDYSSEAYGLAITIRRSGEAMEGQTKGDDAPFPLSYIGKNRFVFVKDGILLEFDKPVSGASPRFILYQQQYAIPLARTP